MIDPADYEDLLAALHHDLQLNLATDVLPNTFPVVSGLMLGQWVTPPLLNSWTNLGAGFEVAGYFKDPLGFVHLRGVIQGGANMTAAFVLPAGYRPGASTVHPATINNTGPQAARVQIDTSGNVTIVFSGATNNVGLSGLTFLAEN